MLHSSSSLSDPPSFPRKLHVAEENNLNQDQTPLGPGSCGSVSGAEDQASHSLICHSVIPDGKSSVVLDEVMLNVLGFLCLFLVFLVG